MSCWSTGCEHFFVDTRSRSPFLCYPTHDSSTDKLIDFRSWRSYQSVSVFRDATSYQTLHCLRIVGQTDNLHRSYHLSNLMAYQLRYILFILSQNYYGEQTLEEKLASVVHLRPALISLCLRFSNWIYKRKGLPHHFVFFI